MTSLLTETGGALVFDDVTWPVALRWLSRTGWRIQKSATGPGQMARIEVTEPDGAIAAGGLSEREVEVLIGISDGRSNSGIGEWLGITEDTIKTHTRHIYKKLGAHDRAHAVAIGFRYGILGGQS